MTSTVLRTKKKCIHTRTADERRWGCWALVSSQPIHSRTVGTDGKTHAKWLTNRMEIHERGLQVNNSTLEGKKTTARRVGERAQHVGESFSC